ncbi:hypothetical protein D030_0977B, partial [Vibrio parahaemolyticus AQ3810]
HVEAVVEVLTKCTLFRRTFKIHFRCRDNANVER